jgi:Xaa-Pro aminopeptidase
MSAAAQTKQMKGRLERLASGLRAQDLDALLVTGEINVRYVTNFTGTSGMALIAADHAEQGERARAQAHGGLAGHRFITDFRYGTQARAEVPDALAREVVLDNLLAAAADALGDEGGRLGFLEKSLTVADHTRLGELLGVGWELVPCAAMLEALRAVKDRGEIERIRAATELADEAMRAVLEHGLVGRSEREIALELELEMRRRGAAGPSFPLIVAAGARAALPHAQPRDREIAPDELVTIDWGALHEGYCSDCTRTYASGEGVSSRAKEVYELVRVAQQQAVEAVRAGAGSRELDAIARSQIEQAGHGEHFGHGLGHGVGMEVHEGPRLSRSAPDQPLIAGNVVTVEPGVYLPGELGVRIEDLLVVGERGHEVLTSLPRELTVIS